MTHTSGKRHTKIFCELEGRSIKTMQYEKEGKKTMEKQTDFEDLWNNFKRLKYG